MESQLEGMNLVKTSYDRPKRPKKTLTRKNTYTSQKGNVAVELAIIFPLLTVLVFVGFDMSWALRTTQFVTTVSREAAAYAYRECNGDEGTKLDGCLQRVINETMADLGNLDDSLQIIVSLYRIDETGNGVMNSQTSDGSGELSKFSVTASPPEINGIPAGAISSAPGGFLVHHEVIVIGEAYVDYAPFTPGLNVFFDQTSEKFYDATIM